MTKPRIAYGETAVLCCSTLSWLPLPRIKQKCCVVKYKLTIWLCQERGQEENGVCPFLRSKYILLLVSNMCQQRDRKWSAFAGQKEGQAPAALTEQCHSLWRLYWCRENKYWLEEYFQDFLLIFYPRPSLLADPGWHGTRAPGGPCLSRSGTPPAPPSTCSTPTASVWSFWAWCSISSGARMTSTTGSMASLRLSSLSLV